MKEKELCKRKESEALCREQLVKNERRLIRMKIKAERLESEARSGFEEGEFETAARGNRKRTSQRREM